ncbi:hypothetical protein [Solibacillus daqui]|uniref:hypothetical protein n=1 Tax=Solibacillus daqui TaxID=2912187 RepID=UPI0023650E77|nr:hypothetical protein [Solibacillus daqui]
MYSENERESYFQEFLVKIRALSGVEGIIQIGSGTVGYTDQYSDIDLMIATNEHVSDVKSLISNELAKMGAYFI